MVLVSHRYQFIFFKNYKAASSSAESFFGQFCVDPAKQSSYSFEDKCDESITQFGIISARLRNFDSNGNNISDSPENKEYSEKQRAYLLYKTKLHNPNTMDSAIPTTEAMWFNYKNALDVKEDLGDNMFDQYTKFCVIRNPYDVMVSSYHYEIKHNSQNSSFKDYCKRLINMPGFYVLNDNERIFLDDKPVCQYYIRYENLKDDVLMVLDKLGITDYDISHLPQHKPSSRPVDVSYQSYYDEETRALVYSAYQKIIDYFGYTF